MNDKGRIKNVLKKSVDSLINEIQIMNDMKSASQVVGIKDFEIVELKAILLQL